MSDELFSKLKLNKAIPLTVLHDDEHLYFTESNIDRNYPTSEVHNIMVFVEDAPMLEKEVFRIIENDLLVTNGRLFVAYPKKGNKKYKTFVSRDELHTLLGMDEERYAKGSAYKFNQLLSLDDTYSLMVLKKVDKSKTKQLDTSARSCNFVDLIPVLEEALMPHETAHSFFQTLPPGYKNSWARYIYSAKQEATRQKRFAETVKLLNDGVKTKK